VSYRDAFYALVKRHAITQTEVDEAIESSRGAGSRVLRVTETVER
jgi:hypothetical protein